jgi:hypothetical protein
VHPGTGRAVQFEAPMPEDIAQLIARLSRNAPASRPARA